MNDELLTAIGKWAKLFMHDTSVLLIISSIIILYFVAGNVSFDDIENAILTNDVDSLKYGKEYNSKWPTGFFLQFSVMFRRYMSQIRVYFSYNNLLEQ